MSLHADVTARARTWLAQDPDPTTRAELEALLAAAEHADDAGHAASAELRERFSGRLAFGTAGLRGVLGAGPMRMNRLLVRRVTAGLADYLIEHVPEARSRGVVVGHDARHLSRELAEDTARILCGAGIRVFLATRAWPTPTTAWAVLDRDAAAGVMVTASHNPPAYNGYKVYWGNGAQIIPPHDAGIAAAIDQVDAANKLTMPALEGARIRNEIVDLGDDVRAAYLAEAAALAGAPDLDRRGLTVAYTPLHGVGGQCVEELMVAAGFDAIHTEPSQREPDGDFPTVAFPNPEEPGAMDRVLALATEVGADLVLANDPDADRLAVALPDADAAGGYRMLSGDQVGALLADYLLSQPADGPRLVATTIVSSQLLRYLAEAAGVAYRETLTGFKWIANAAMAWSADPANAGGRFVMGYEEALGYTVGELVRDKDGVSAAMIFAELAAWNRARGRTVAAHLDDIYRRVGLFLTEQVSITAPGSAGLQRIRDTMTRFRTAAPATIAGHAVTEAIDLEHGAGDLPAADVLIWRLAGGRRVIMRPSGTEPKLKSYYEVRVEVGAGEDLAAARARARAELDALRDAHQAMVAADA